MEENKPTPLITWLRLAAGFVIFIAMGFVWVFDDHFDEWLFVLPAALMGIDPRELLKKKE